MCVIRFSCLFTLRVSVVCVLFGAIDIVLYIFFFPVQTLSNATFLSDFFSLYFYSVSLYILISCWMFAVFNMPSSSSFCLFIFRSVVLMFCVVAVLHKPFSFARFILPSFSLPSHHSLPSTLCFPPPRPRGVWSREVSVNVSVLYCA